jgi:tetratricopeptide (TPR) repeat protein
MTSRKRRSGLQWGCAALILFFVIAPNAGWGQASAPAVSAAPLPPAAQDALSKGIIAAKVPDYPLAIRYFEEARRLAPAAPVVFLNLGIAESKLPGRELRAIAWFGAYLAATPDAPNAAAVKEQLAVLEVRNQSNVSRFLKTVQAAADLVKDDHGLGLVRRFAEVQIKAGDLPGARNNLASAARTQIGNTLGDVRVQTMVLTSIAKEQIKAGDLRGARGTLESAQQTADRIRELPQYKASEQRDVAEAQIVAGDVAGAQKTLASMQKTTALIKDSSVKGGQQFSNDQIQRWIDAAQAKAANAATPNRDPQPTPNTSPPIQPVIAVSDWLKKLDDDNKDNDCPLNTRLFLDLPGYLKSLPPSDDSAKILEGLLEPADRIITAQNAIQQMLKRQANK